MSRTTAETPALPRSQTGSSSQHLLTTLLGDYWAGRDEHLPSAALVALLGEFDIGPTAARAALNRLARRGVLLSSRVGRNSYYGFAPGASEMLLAGAHEFVSFGHGAVNWDGQWTVALFALTEAQRDLRYSLRSRLRWLGFAPLFDGTWVSPRPVADQAWQQLDELGIHDVTILRAVEQPNSARRPIDAWNLEEVAAAYTDFVDAYQPLCEQVRAGEVSASQALLARTRIMDSWRTFPGIDPDLPATLLPADWPGHAAHDIFVEVYDELGPLAAIRVRQIIDRYTPQLSHLIDHRTTGQLLELGRQAVDRRRLSARTPDNDADGNPQP